MTRRALLTGGGALVAAAAVGGLVDAGVVPGRGHLERALGVAPGQGVNGVVPSGPAGPVHSGRLDSRRFRRSVGYAVAYPPGQGPGSDLPVALGLPGRGMTASGLLSGLGWPQFLGGYVRRGGRPFAIAAVDGGTSYWHPRSSGLDPLGMLTDELLPTLARMGLATARIGALGVSMGGYGSLLLARQSARGQLGGRHVAVAAAASPALWSSAGATAPGAFDDAVDWCAWGDLCADPGVAAATPLFVACGSGDPFASAVRTYRTATGEPSGGFTPGAHTEGYWRSMAAAQIAFVGDHLA